MLALPTTLGLHGVIRDELQVGSLGVFALGEATPGACTGYPANFHVRASAKCNGTTNYGPWVLIAGYSYVYCNSGQVMSGGTYSVSP